MPDITPAPDQRHILSRLTLILGGARSGKSAEAERRALMRAEELGVEPVYLATAQAWDEEMAARIAQHQQQRATAGWRTVEEPRALATVLAREAGVGRVVLVDCLTLWLSNLMMEEADIPAAVDGLLETLEAVPGDIILVTSEVGLGIVPENAMARQFRDHAGLLHQRLGARAETVVMMVAGLVMPVKG